MEYLKDEQHYIDRYDLHTIEECLDYYWSIKDHFAKEKDSHFAKYTQKKFDTGYARSARILDELEGAGIVGPGEGGKPRKVLNFKK